ncbi:MAG: hypothetical protein JXA93_03545 [Anaerolineae bacterium]|nr:hypothetical protein [Anaerolineae bacterium]
MTHPDSATLSEIRSPDRPVPFAVYIGHLIGQPNLTLAVGAFVLGLLGNVLASALGDWSLWGISGNLIIILLLGACVVGLYAYYRIRRPGVVIEMKEEQPTGKAGLILLLSTLNPRASGTPDEIKRKADETKAAAERIAAADPSSLLETDFAAMLNTNLEPALRALEFHLTEGTLRECWAIGTPDEAVPGGEARRGSAWLSCVLERWFNHLHPDNSVHFAEPCQVSPHDYVSLWNHVDSIFRTSPYRARHIICDITGGLKLMSVGASLACLSEGRTMQYMATNRDWKGDPVPKGQMVPVLVDVNPYLV